MQLSLLGGRAASLRSPQPPGLREHRGCGTGWWGSFSTGVISLRLDLWPWMLLELGWTFLTDRQFEEFGVSSGRVTWRV